MRTFTIVVGLGLALCSGVALAQSDIMLTGAMLSGTVYNCDDRPLRDFVVELQGPNLPEILTKRVDEDGAFEFPLLPLGHYELTVGLGNSPNSEPITRRKVKLVEANRFWNENFTICPPRPRFKVGTSRRSCDVAWPTITGAVRRRPCQATVKTDPLVQGEESVR